jgi:TnpA family transposase
VRRTPPTFGYSYILDILQNTLGEIHPTRLYADSHGQSTHVFALAYLLGIELLPRIRAWKRLKLYRPSRNSEFEAISHLFSATVDWSLIERHYPDFIRLALAIHQFSKFLNFGGEGGFEDEQSGGPRKRDRPPRSHP